MIRVGIIGAAGYTAGELIRLLVNHPEVEITFAHSTSNAGQPFHAVHTGLIGDTEQCFSETYDLHAIDVLFRSDQVANWYGMFLHESQYMEPVMRDIEAMLESSQRNVNGKVDRKSVV